MPFPAALEWLLELDDVQAAAYHYIRRHGTATGPGLAHALGKSRTTAYEVLRSLVDKGVLVEEPGRPMRYVLRPIEEALLAKRNELEQRLDAARAATASVPTRVRRGPGYMAMPGAVATFHGVEGIVRETLRMVATQSERVLIAGREAFGNHPHEWSLVAEALAKQQALVRIYLPEQDDASDLANLLRERLGRERLVRLADEQAFQVGAVVVDHAGLLVFRTSQTAPEPHIVGLRIASPAFASLLQDALVALARPHLSAPLAPPGSWEGLRDFLAAVEGASSSVLTLLGPGWRNLYGPDDVHKVAKVLGQAAERGLRVQTLIDADVTDVVVLRELQLPAGVQLRIGDWIPCWVSIVDEAMLYQGFSLAQEGMVGRLSSDPDELRIFLHLFEDAWQKGQPLPQ